MTWLLPAALALGIAALHVLAMCLNPAPHEWRPSGSDTMRRKVRGRWQYRPMTEAEAAAEKRADEARYDDDVV